MGEGEGGFDQNTEVLKHLLIKTIFAILQTRGI